MSLSEFRFVRFSLIVAIICFVQTADFCRADDVSISTDGLATIYDGKKPVGQVLSWEGELGKGGFGTVQQAEIVDGFGRVQNVAIKRFSNETTETQRNTALAGWRLIKKLQEKTNDAEGVLVTVLRGSRLETREKSGKIIREDITITPVYDGRAHGYLQDLRMSFFSPSRQRILPAVDLAIRFKSRMLKAIELMSSGGLVHGDIKPANVLTLGREVGSLTFSLADFDTVKPIGVESRVSGTQKFMSPEVYMAKSSGQMIKTSAAADVYSLAAATYQMLFTQNAIDAYIGTRPKQALTQAQVYADPMAYAEFQNWVDGRFRNLAFLAPNSAKPKVSELRQFVKSGLEFSPVDRLRHFPTVGVGCAENFALISFGAR